MIEPTLTSLRETADRLDKIMEVSSPWVHAKMTPMLRDAADVIEGLEAENAKLRELVADMWFWHYEGHIDSESRKRQMLHINAVIQSMRELGIEVE